MFVVQNRSYNEQILYRHLKNKNLGRQADASSEAYLLLVNGRFCSDLPSFINLFKIFIMQNRRSASPTKEQLAEIKAELQTLNPELKRLKVKKFYNKGRVTAHADLGSRRIHVRSSLSNIIDKFIEQYNERYPTAFTNLNTI